MFGLIETHGVPTHYRIYWGRSKAYGHHAYTFERHVAFSRSRPVGVEGEIEGLKARTTYH
jgi:hypothetical protein